MIIQSLCISLIPPPAQCVVLQMQRVLSSSGLGTHTRTEERGEDEQRWSERRVASSAVGKEPSGTARPEREHTAHPK